MEDAGHDKGYQPHSKGTSFTIHAKAPRSHIQPDHIHALRSHRKIPVRLGVDGYQPHGSTTAGRLLPGALLATKCEVVSRPA